MSLPILRTELCDLLDIEYPIMLAGMGVWGMGTPPELVAAADTVTEMGLTKHAFAAGIQAMAGMEF